MLKGEHHQSLSLKPKETTSDTKIYVKAGETQNPDTKGDNTARTSTSDSMIGDKEMVKPTSNSASKTDSKFAEVSSSDSKAAGSTSTQSTSNNKHTKKTGLGNTQQNGTVNIPSASFSETGGEKPDESPSTPQAKQESDRPQQPISRPPLGENIVLGVALEGSKRTLPIEEGMAPSPTQAEVKELAQFRNGNGSLAAEKDKKESQPPTVPSSTSG
ncbi:MSCS-like 2 [Actinidia rufa]|uniref:MSCS-like 2 n=1 Tax=Actinidia rufa TaxID=165716 RepID=A0A7J0DGX6_9ERIC|nr:MSCS-like 2 [Actinidia rufa]